jgi:integrase
MSHWISMHDRVEAYLDTRRSLGYALLVEGEQLKNFARFAETRGHRSELTIELALAWANASRRGSRLYRARRLEIVRSLAKYCILFEPETEIPAPGLLGPAHRRVTPHIYSEQEVADLLAAAEHLAPKAGLRPLTIRCFLGLLASTGLRVCEALRLARNDIDFTNGVLTVWKTKFRKSRHVPLHHTTVKALKEYAQLRDCRVPYPQALHFLLMDNGQPLRYRQARYAFDQLRRQLGWESQNGRRPRLYDLRHTFACRRLQRWYEEGVDVNWAMPFLSTYLGHGKVTDTYWYLTATPSLMTIISTRFERLAFAS